MGLFWRNWVRNGGLNFCADICAAVLGLALASGHPGFLCSWSFSHLSTLLLTVTDTEHDADPKPNPDADNDCHHERHSIAINDVYRFTDWFYDSKSVSEPVAVTQPVPVNDGESVSYGIQHRIGVIVGVTVAYRDGFGVPLD